MLAFGTSHRKAVTSEVEKDVTLSFLTERLSLSGKVHVRPGLVSQGLALWPGAACVTVVGFT